MAPLYSPSPAFPQQFKIIISATTEGNRKKKNDELFSHYSVPSPETYTGLLRSLQLKYMGLIILMILELNMCLNAPLNQSQLKHKGHCTGVERDVYQPNTEFSHSKL